MSVGVATDVAPPQATRSTVDAGPRKETAVFAACVAAIALQCIVESAAVSTTANDLAHRPLWLVALAMPVAGLLFARGGRMVRTTLALLLGLVGTTLGVATSVSHAALAGVAPADCTGIVATLAGLVLIGLGFRLALTGRRLAAKLILGLLLAFALVQWGLMPAITAGVASHASHPTIPPAASLELPGARDVSFSAADGTRLSGWYVPGRTGATVIALHGSHGTRTDTIRHMRMLSAAGYGVLAYDARGHGASGGRANAFGWQGNDDIAAAVRFLQGQPGVNRARIAALGLSMGAEESLRAAADGVPLAAVVADGAGTSTQGDGELVGHGPGPLYSSVTWLAMREVELASGSAEPPALKRVVGRIHVPVLLIASNARNEHAVDSAYARLIGSNATLWYVAHAQHTEALRTVPRAYVARVVAFLGAAFGKAGHR